MPDLSNSGAMGISYCEAYPWSCTPFLFQFLKGHLLYFTVLIIFTAILTFFIKIILRKSLARIKFLPLLSIIFLITLVSVISYKIFNIIVHAGDLGLNKEVLNCVLRNAPEECYHFAAISEYRNSSNYLMAHKICNLVRDPNDCKMEVCDNLSESISPQECRDKVLRTCPDGYILDNIPCACNVPAGPYATYDEQWLKNYWNKYRNGDTFKYCCSGKQQDGPCP